MLARWGERRVSIAEDEQEKREREERRPESAPQISNPAYLGDARPLLELRVEMPVSLLKPRDRGKRSNNVRVSKVITTIG